MMRRRLLEITDSIPYIPVEYIRCTETQYIDTNLLLNQGDKITLIFWLADGGNKTEVVWGYRWYGTYNNRSHGYISTTASGYRRIVLGVVATTTGVGSDTCYSFNTKNTLIIDTANSLVTLNNEPVTFNYSLANGRLFDSSGSSEYSPLLFTMNDKGNVNTNAIPVNCRIYEYIVERDGVEIQHLIPCIRNSDNTVCMYDLVSKTFFTNNGTGDFLTT